MGEPRRPLPRGSCLPLILAATIAYAAGLLTGFGGLFIPGALAAVIAGGWAALHRSAMVGGLILIAMSGMLIASADHRGSRACRAMLERAGSWAMELDDAAGPGAYVRGRVTMGGCSMPASLSVRRGAASAGSRVVAEGHGVLGARSLLIRNASLSPPMQGSPLVRWRAAAGRAIDRTFGSDAGLARALLIADTRGIPVEMRERYAAAGVVHLLSISGLHVAIIAAAVHLALQVLRLPARSASLAALGLTALYIAMIGAPAPAVRSGVMLGVTAVSRLVQRPTSPWAALALGAALPLVQPRTVLDLGYQLSVAGMAGIIASGALARRAIAPRCEGAARWLATNLAASIIAGLVTTPLVAWTFGRVSLIAPVTNLVATPVLGVAQPMLFLALLAAPLDAVARFIADAAHPLLALFDGISSIGAAVPHASVPVAPTALAAVLGGAFSVCILVACVARFPRRALVAAAGTATALVWLPIVPHPVRGVELHMIDVGQGDALALRTPGNRWILFDAGRAWRGGDAGRSTVIPYLRRRGGGVEAFVLSHPHEDHVGGAATILEALRPRLYLDAAYASGSDAYRASLSAAVTRNIPWRRVHPGDSLEIDGVMLRVLAPDSAWTTQLDDPNDASVVVMVRYRDVRFLLTGDAETAEEAWLVESAGESLSADVLKVAHHGSRTSTTPAFLAAVRPRIALISVGAGNRYGHPGRRVLDDLAASGAMVVRSDRSGSVIVRSDGKELSLEVQGDSWPLPRGSAPP